MLRGKNILVCVTGGIAAYKMPNLVSMLAKQGCNVNVLMTKNAENFITVQTFEALTKNPCITDTFERTYPIEIHHISLAEKADYVLISPASADILGKLSHGIADDMITSTVLAMSCCDSSVNERKYVRKPCCPKKYKYSERTGVYYNRACRGLYGLRKYRKRKNA